jgi:hypothetical protein
MKYKIGTKIGKLTIVDYDSNKCYYYFKCDCNECFVGTTQTIKAKQSLLQKYKTAGCKLCMNVVRRQHLSDAELFLPIYKQYKRGSTKRFKDRVFKLTLEECISMFKSKCFYCLVDPSNSIKVGQRIINYQGIDRLEQDKGYTTDNVVPCCKTCNYSKNTLDYKNFIEHITKIYINVQRLDRKVVESSGSKQEASDCTMQGKMI